jgi:hypothetical protein
MLYYLVGFQPEKLDTAPSIAVSMAHRPIGASLPQSSRVVPKRPGLPPIMPQDPELAVRDAGPDRFDHPTRDATTGRDTSVARPGTHRTESCETGRPPLHPPGRH